MPAKPIPRLPGLPLLGNLLDFKNDRLALYHNIQERFGPIGIYTLLSQPFAVTCDAELTRSMLIEHHADFERSPVMRMMKPILGEGLLTADNPENSRQRQWITPAFQADRYPHYARLIVEHTRSLQARWANGQSLNLSAAMQELTLGIIGEALFGINVLEEFPPFGQAVTSILRYTDDRLKLMLPLPLNWPLPINLRLWKAMKPLNEFLEQLICRRENGLLSAEHTTAGSSDLLELLLRARDEESGQPLSHQAIRDQILTFLFAGHETTANTLSWTFFLLARNPAVYDTLRCEIESVLLGEPPTFEDLKRLPYALQVIKEALRLYPPAYAFGRTATRTLRLGDFEIPEGMVVLTAPYVMHRQARYFPDPERFDPARFSPERESLIPRFAYLPFGAGPRACIGRQFALMEAHLILVAIAQNYRFSLLNETEIRPEPMVTLRPSTGIQVLLEKVPARHPSAVQAV